MPNLDFVTPTGFYNYMEAALQEEFVQVAATTFNPAGLVSAMSLEPLGITQVLQATGNTDSIAVVNIAIPPLADKTKAASVRVGWSTPSTTVSNTVDFSVSYKYLAVDSDTDGAEDGNVHDVVNPSATADGYQFASFALPAPGITSRVIQIRVTRHGTTDTETADAHLLGVIAAFTPIQE
jgi:hypothetical protein